MKKSNQKSIEFSLSKLTLEITDQDPLLWKLSMIMEAVHNPDKPIEEIASKYGYTRGHFYEIVKKLKKEGPKAFIEKKSTGPKTNYRRTEELTRQVIQHRFLDPDASCEVIAQKLKQTGYNVSQRSVERVVNQYGLQKRGAILKTLLGQLRK